MSKMQIERYSKVILIGGILAIIFIFVNFNLVREGIEAA